MNPVGLVMLGALVHLALPERPLSRADGWAELEAGRFGAAEAAFVAEEDALARARGLAEVYYGAGRPRRALDAVQAGLAGTPDDLTLLHRAVASALWLEDLELARGFQERLRGAVSGADLGDDRAGWDGALEGFEEHLVRAEALAAARGRAIRVARTVSLTLLGASLAGFVFLSRSGGSTSVSASEPGH